MYVQSYFSQFCNKLLIVAIIFYSIVTVAQNKNKSIIDRQESTTYQKEKEELDRIESLFDNGNQKEGYKMTHQISQRTKNEIIQTRTLLILGNYFNTIDLPDSSLFYGNKVIDLVKNKKDTVSKINLSNAYNIIGNAYGDKNLLEKSKLWHFKGLEISEKYLIQEHYYKKLINLASNYNRSGQYDYAIELLKPCLQWDGDQNIKLGIYANLAIAYSYKDLPILSIEYFKKCLQFFKGNNSNNEVAVTQNIGAQYHIMKEYDKALAYYKKAYQIAELKGYHRTAIDAMTNMGLVYQEKKQYSRAEEIFVQTLIITKKKKFTDKTISLLEHLEKNCKELERYKEAYDFYNKKVQLKDSIRLAQQNSEIKELEIRFKTLQKEKEIKLLTIENKNRELESKSQQEAITNLTLQQEIKQKENQNKILVFQNTNTRTINENLLLKSNQEIKEVQLEVQQAETRRQKEFKNTIIYFFLILLVPIIGLLIIYYQKLQTQNELNQKQKEINNQKIASLLKDQELKIIKTSVDIKSKERKRIAQELHDSIGGNLAAIKLQLNNTIINTNKKELKSINSQIDETYIQVRNLSHNLLPKKFDNNHFCDVIEEYLNNISGVTNINSSFSPYPKTDINQLEENLQVQIYQIIQELITNTIKHAKATTIELQINISDHIVNILFEDNGIGFDIKLLKEGIGLKNIKSRLHQISGVLHIDSRKKRGTIINIEIPIISSKVIESKML
ncbi:tetratricopeptide repeat-containing sensor histidine kinase [Aquimarina addita]